MPRCIENTAFECIACKNNVPPVTNGSYRNHCPFCLYSLHVDHMPGDRANACKGLMKPVGLHYKSNKGWQIIHKCLRCKMHKANKIAEDTLQPDCYKKIAMLGSGYRGES